MTLHSQRLLSDPRIVQAKALIQEAVADQKKTLISIQPPTGDSVDYDALLNGFHKARGNPLFYPYVGSGFGNGPLVELADGSVKYDMITGIGVHNMGHNHPAMIDSSFNAMLSDTIMQGNLQQNHDSLKLMNRFIDLANQGGARLDHCFLSTSGATANENALKIAFQKHQPANRILAFERCFMGRTLALASLTDKHAYRVGLPKTVDVDYVPYYDSNDHDGSIKRAVNCLKSYIQRYPGQHAVMCFEMIQGEGGYYPGNHDFFKALMTILKEHDIAIFVDEVQSFGRTENAFAFQTFQIDDFVDIVSIGKMTQVCATLYKHDYLWKPGLISQTFTSSSAAIQASLTVLELMEDGFLGDFGRNMAIHQQFALGLDAIAMRNPGFIKGPYGYGLMIAFTPFDGSLEKTKATIHRLYENGVIAFVAARNPYRIRFLPPAFVLDDETIDQVLAILEDTLIMLDQEFQEH